MVTYLSLITDDTVIGTVDLSRICTAGELKEDILGSEYDLNDGTSWCVMVEEEFIPNAVTAFEGYFESLEEDMYASWETDIDETLKSGTFLNDVQALINKHFKDTRGTKQYTLGEHLVLDL